MIQVDICFKRVKHFISGIRFIKYQKMYVMRSNETNPRVDIFLSKADKWQDEMEQLRSIILDCGLAEELKWGKPCYTFQGKNIVIIQGFKEYCALLFFKGVLLDDPDNILIKTGQNTDVGRQIRFVDVRKIVEMKSTLKSYIDNAIEVEKSGQKIEVRKSSEFVISIEFQNKLKEMPALKTAFEALTPGRQRAYIFYFSAPKQSRTRESRIEKYIPHIIRGKGLND